MRLTLRQKIFVGYAVMVFFTLIVGVYAIWSLQGINNITATIMFDYLSASEKLTKLNDNVQAQDLYEKRFLMFQQQEAENMFWERSKEFNNLLSALGATVPYLNDSIQTVKPHHDTYNSLFTKEISYLKAKKRKQAETLSSGELRSNLEKILLSLEEMEKQLKTQQMLYMNQSNALTRKSLVVTIILSAIASAFGLLFAYMITNHLSKSIEKLKEATDSISSGVFDIEPEIRGSDELADLAISFKEMTARLKELEQMNLDANPLTKLPGNLAIEKELLTRLNETSKFSFCLIDLDNFKAFSDKYGYARGSEVLKWTADLLMKIKKEYGAENDFLGHIGGDDFVIICSPERVHTICTRIIEEFDRGITEHYDPEDLKKGFIISVDRNDKPAMFGIMTISIAVVNTDRTLIREPKEVAQKVAELKQYAKTFAKSIYIMDRRRTR